MEGGSATPGPARHIDAGNTPVPLAVRLGIEDIRAQSDENRWKVLSVERGTTELRRTVEELAEELRGGIKRLQGDFGRLKTESRFANTVSKALSPPASLGRNSTGSTNPDSYGVLAGATSALPADSNARLDALEAACEDLRQNMQEMTTVPEATTQLVRSELHRELGQMREELLTERSRTQNNTTDLIRLEASTIELKQSIAEFERKMVSSGQEQNIELSACKEGLEASLQASLQHYEQRMSQATELQATQGTELMNEVAQLRGKLEFEYTKVEQDAQQRQELSQRLIVSERQLADLHERQREQLEQTVSMQSRLEVADGRMEEEASRFSFVQSLLEEERRLRAAELDELKQQALAERASRSAYIQSLLEDERRQRSTELEDLKQQLTIAERASRSSYVQSLLEDERRQRAAELETLRQQLAAVAMEKASPVAPSADCTQRLEKLEATQQLSSALGIQGRVERLEAQQSQPSAGILSRIEQLEDSCLDMSHRLNKCALPQPGADLVRADMQKELQQLRREMEDWKVEHARQPEDTDRTQEPAEERIEDLVAKVLDEQLRAALGQGSTPKNSEGVTRDCSSFALLLGQVEARQAVLGGSLSSEVALLKDRLEGLEKLHTKLHGMQQQLQNIQQQQQQQQQQQHQHQHQQQEPNPLTEAPTLSTAGILKLQAALADCSGDVASLAKELAAVRMEHDAAFKKVGGLPNLVTSAAAASIEHAQELLAAEFVARREELAQAATQQHEMLREQTQVLMRELAVMPTSSPVPAAPGDTPEDQRNSPQGAAETRRLHAMLESCVGQMEAMQLTIHDLRPRVQALETVFAAQCRSSRPAWGVVPRGQNQRADDSPAAIATTALTSLSRDPEAATVCSQISETPSAPRQPTGSALLPARVLDPLASPPRSGSVLPNGGLGGSLKTAANSLPTPKGNVHPQEESPPQGGLLTTMRSMQQTQTSSSASQGRRSETTSKLSSDHSKTSFDFETPPEFGRTFHQTTSRSARAASEASTSGSTPAVHHSPIQEFRVTSPGSGPTSGSICAVCETQMAAERLDGALSTAGSTTSSLAGRRAHSQQPQQVVTNQLSNSHPTVSLPGATGNPTFKPRMGPRLGTSTSPSSPKSDQMRLSSGRQQQPPAPQQQHLVHHALGGQTQARTSTSPPNAAAALQLCRAQLKPATKTQAISH